MAKYLLEGFEPQRVLRHFEDLCAIPHGSGHEEALAAHIAALFHQNNPGAVFGGGIGSRKAGGAAAQHQYVGMQFKFRNHMASPLQ